MKLDGAWFRVTDDAGAVRWKALAALVAAALAVLLLFPGPRRVLRVPVDRLAACFRHDAWVEGELPASRGCILDQNGRPLAWSTRHFALYWRVPEQGAAAREELAILQTYCPPVRLAFQELGDLGGRRILLRDNLSGRDVQNLSRLRRDIPGMEISSYTIRHHVSVTGLAARIGEAQMLDGAERGVSGAELEHDRRLRGQPGRFRIMVDTGGRWIPETWQKTAEVRPGYDVYLPVSLDGASALTSTAAR
jgi:cell division protein FtsI/penicillin-binding protein 2